ncbi:MAG: hypothetical protein HQK60_14780 [Deltaproteobacteria bacterium]|nr:hypothetical protein [Deltaproteobacteria bacterium]
MSISQKSYYKIPCCPEPEVSAGLRVEIEERTAPLTPTPRAPKVFLGRRTKRVIR